MTLYDIDGNAIATTEGSGGGSSDDSTVFTAKRASFYGDSLTEVNYQYTKGYHAWVKEILGLTGYNNYGVSGYKISNVIDKMNSVTDNPDIVFVMAGVNDENYNTPLGTISDTTVGTIYGGYDVLCKLVKQKYPSKVIVFITPHFQTRYPHSGGITSYEVSRAMIEVATKYSIPVYDNYVFSGIDANNLNIWTNDNCHWNDKAHEMVGKNLAKWVIDHFRYLYIA